jgi:hypothetical protein
VDLDPYEFSPRFRHQWVRSLFVYRHLCLVVVDWRVSSVKLERGFDMAQYHSAQFCHIIVYYTNNAHIAAHNCSTAVVAFLSSREFIGMYHGTS